MLDLRVLIVFVIVTPSPATLAQDLHEWKSKSGHSTKAAFLKVDEANQKVTLLVPKEIDFNTLEKGIT